MSALSQIVSVIIFFAGWVNSIMTAIESGHDGYILLSLCAAPISSIYGLYLFF